MSVPSPPEYIDPVDIVAFALTCTSAVSEEHLAFQELFSTLFTPSSTASLSPCVRMYIVRQPVPAKHRRSYVEVRDLRSLCGRSNPSLTSENDLKDAVIVMKKVSCSDHHGRSLALPVPPSKSPLCDTIAVSASSSDSNGEWSLGDRQGLGGEASSGPGSGYSSFTEDNIGCLSGSAAVLASGVLRVPIEIFEPQALSQSGLSPDLFASSDDDEEDEDDGMDDESEGEDGHNSNPHNSTSTSSESIKPSRKVRRLRSNPRNITEQAALGSYQFIPATLPSRFRPLVQDGEVQFEVWVVAFLMSPPSSAFRNEGSEVIEQVLIDPQQRAISSAHPVEQRPVLVNLPNTMPAAATAGNTTIITIMNQPSERQRQISNWIEQVAQFLGTQVLQSFVKNEVAQSRIGIDFKRILQEKKMRPQRRVVH